MTEQFTKHATADTRRLVFFILKKFAKIGLRWTAYLSLGIIAWILLDPLPPAFMWVVILSMLGSMSIHTILHRNGVTSGFAKQACRFVFFLSIPMLFVFGGNRFAIWSVSDEPAAAVQIPAAQPVQQGVVAMEEYTVLKKLHEEGFKDPKKARKTVKKFFKKHLQKFKEMDSSAKLIFLVLGIILLVFILVLLFLYVFVNETTSGCLEVSGGADSSCCME
jgi:hypothetical protein